jgi:uncharacterized protein
MNPDEIKALVRYRLEQAKESLMDAKVLVEAERTPRSIINRCYYAMFYAALALLQSIEKMSSKHTGVLGLFDREFIQTGIFSRVFSKDYHRGFDLRQTSDYDVAPSVDRETALDLLQKAKGFVEAAEKYLAEQGRL